MSFDEDADPRPPGGRPLPPDDRLWRHPSEIGPPTGGQRPPPPAAVGERPPSRHAKATWGLIVASAACGAVAAAGALLALGVGRDAGSRDVREWVLPATEQRDPAEIAREVLPSVVRLEVAGPTEATIGSGVVFRDDGHVLTSAHLLDQATDVVAVLQSGERHGAVIVGADEISDVGVVKIDAPGVPSAPLGSVAGLQEGEAIISIGSSPTPGRAPVITRTVVSDVGARLDDQQAHPLYGMLRLTSVTETPGAGAVVVDQFGAVIGVTTRRQPSAGLTTTSLTSGAPAGRSGDAPATFATPVDYARKVADDIISTGQARHVWLGIEQTDSEVTGTGARVYQVAPDSPADVAGLEPDDVVMTVGGHRVHSMADVIVSLRQHHPDESVDIEYRRGDQVLTCTSTLTTPPAE